MVNVCLLPEDMPMGEKVQRGLNTLAGLPGRGLGAAGPGRQTGAILQVRSGSRTEIPGGKLCNPGASTIKAECGFQFFVPSSG